MTRDFTDFSVEIKKLKYTTDEGNVFPKTAIITFSLPDTGKKSVELLGYIDPEEIYRMIHEGESINLNDCYIDKFSLSEYRIIHEKEKKDIIEIHSFSAKNCFFNIKSKIDFSNVHFNSGNVSFDNAILLSKNISFNNTNFGDGEVNFSYTSFRAPHVDFGNARFGKGNVNFKNAIFDNGLKDFQYADFGGGTVSFVNTEFNNGDVSFINTTFNNGDISFKVARFGTGKVDFHYAKFGEGDISFERTEFGNGRVDFRTVEFNNGKINFNRSVFGSGEVSFEASELKSGKMMFKRAMMDAASVSFELAEFKNAELYLDGTGFGPANISFFNAKFSKLSLRSCHLDHYLDLRVSYTGYLDLSDTIARDIIDMMPYDFTVNVGVLNLTGMRLIGRIYIDWEENKVEKMIKGQGDTTERQKAEQFRILKQNFNVTGHYNDEDKAYVEFKRFESRAVLHEAGKRRKINLAWEYPIYGFKWLVFDKVGLYATAPARVLFSVIVVYLFFSLVYYIFPFIFNTNVVSSLGDPDKLSAIQVALYHSVITFFTIGYGDYYPSGVIRWISGFEGFAGVFLMSYFTVAFVRKVLR